MLFRGLWTLFLLGLATSTFALPVQQQTPALPKRQHIRVGRMPSDTIRSTSTTTVSGSATVTPTGPATTIFIGFQPPSATASGASSASTSDVSTISLSYALPTNSNAPPLAFSPPTSTSSERTTSISFTVTKTPSQAVAATTTAALSPISTSSSTDAQASTAAATATASSSTSAASANLQAFTGSLGGVTAPPVATAGSNQFSVDDGTDSLFDKQADALKRSCADQHNECANAANADLNDDFTVGDCDTQQTQCLAANGIS
ncbi:hypothetical protein HMN09_00415100 [Mycena chlorophos]|uniref:Uncharacterized protein n=1 Tax=Mycena chlorophos TaxID=658473 RepID=A0A8H6TDI1_MYCCL|nr:hypothetical protein HMN09_00415100 [Mycena chlorophos]